MERFLIWVVFLPQGSGSVSGFWCLFSVAGFDSHCPSNHNTYIKDDSSLPFVGIFGWGIRLYFKCFAKICIYVCVGLRSNGISIIPHRYPCVPQEVLLNLLGNICPPCLLWQRAIGFSPWARVGWWKMPSFLLEKSCLSNTCSYPLPLHNLSKILQDM